MKIKRLSYPTEEIKTKDLGEGVVEVVVSTNNLDRHGERLSIKGLDIKKYNGVVLLNHDSQALPIGRSVYLKKKSVDGVETLVSRTEFAVNQYPLAKTVYNLVKDGFMPDVSIGFIPKEWDSDSNTWVASEMIEYSHVGIAANPDAHVTGKALEAIGVTEEEFEEEVIDFMEKNREAQLKQVTSEPVEEADDTLETESKGLVVSASALHKLLCAASDVKTGTKSHKRKLVLVRAKKHAQSIDRQVEALLMGIKNEFKERD